MNHQLFNLLGRDSKFYFSLIDLLQVEESWLEVKKISTKLKVSDRSSQRYIIRFKRFIKQCNQEKNTTLKIHNEKFKGIKLEFTSVSIETLKLYILNSDKNIQLLLDICLLRSECINKYSYKNRLSSYGVKNSITEINLFLKPFELKVENGNLSLIGEEKIIRFFSYRFVWEVLKNDVWPFHYIDENKVYQSIYSLEKEFSCQYSNNQKRQIAYFIAICLIRNRKKFYIESIENWGTYLNVPVLRREQLIVNEMKNYQIFENNELTFLLMVLQMKHGMYQSSKIKVRILNYHKKNNTDIYQITNLVLKEFQRIFFTIPEEFIDTVYTYLFCTHLQSRILSDVPIDLDGYDLIKKNSIPEQLICEVRSFIKKMKICKCSDIFDAGELLVRRYLLIFAFFENWVNYEPQITICVDSTLSFFLREHLKKSILRHFTGIYNLKIESSETTSKTYDLIVTNVLPLNNYSEENICIVSLPLGISDFLRIEKKILEKIKVIHNCFDFS